MEKDVARCEDMRPLGLGWLRVIIQDDGDAIVEVYAPADHYDRHPPTTRSVEFCTVGSGGGRSQRTVRALHDLARAIEADNAETPMLAPRSDEFLAAWKRRNEGAEFTGQLPAVAGDWMEMTIAQFELRAQVLLADEQEKPNPDNALIAFLCDAVRLSREHVRLMQTGIPHA